MCWTLYIIELKNARWNNEISKHSVFCQSPGRPCQDSGPHIIYSLCFETPNSKNMSFSFTLCDSIKIWGGMNVRFLPKRLYIFPASHHCRRYLCRVYPCVFSYVENRELVSGWTWNLLLGSFGKIQVGARNVIPLIVHVTHFYYYKNIWHLVQN